MSQRLNYIIGAACLLGSGIGLAQGVPARTVPAGTAIDEALQTSSLTYLGRPFHAVMEIDEPKHRGGIYKARIDLYWADAKKYRLEAASKDFSQTLVMNGDQIQETDTGDFYPKWLREFVWALLDPAPHSSDKELRAGMVRLPNNLMPNAIMRPQACAVRVDRTNGISNLLTEGEICFDVPEHRLINVQWFEYGMGFSEPKSFDHKQIATKYSAMLSTVPSDEYITFLEGRLVTLEKLSKIDETKFQITQPTPASDRIQTVSVSTLQEEAMLETAPTMDWPLVTHGVTEGYLIVHSLTDRTGQVRSAWRVSADNSWMEPYAMQQALKYKFKQLLVDGVAVQMEMPLVMHFSSHIDDSMPKFSAETISQVASGCKTSKLPIGVMEQGTAFQALVFVNEAGKLAGIDYAKGVPMEMQRAANEGLYECKFTQYKVDGVSKYYHVEFSFVAP